MGFFSRKKVTCRELANTLLVFEGRQVENELTFEVVLTRIRQVDSELADRLQAKFDTEEKVSRIDWELFAFANTAVIYGVRAALSDPRMSDNLLDEFHKQFYSTLGESGLSLEQVIIFEQFLKERYARYYGAYGRRDILKMGIEALIAAFGEDILDVNYAVFTEIGLDIGLWWASLVKTTSDFIKRFNIICE